MAWFSLGGGLKTRKGGDAPKSVGLRAFSAAEVSRVLAPWVWDGGFSNTEISASLTTIRARSRDMSKNSEYYVRWLNLFVDNVIGDGLKFKALPCLTVGKPAVDEAAAKFLQYHFWKWSTDPFAADVTGRKTFAGICKLAAENWARDGEAFLLIDRHAQTDYGFALRVVRPDAIDETMNGHGLTPATVVRNGVEVNRKSLRVVAYYFRANREDPAATWLLNRPVVRVPAADVLHLFTQHDETQTRGIPLGHAVLKKLKMLDEYNVAELVAARDEANTLGIFSAPAGREDEIEALNEDDEATGQLCQRSEPGTKWVLPKGWGYDPKTPQHPNREVTAFKNTMLRDIASGLGVEYANFANDWGGVNYSSVRAGTLAERDRWRTLQAAFVEQVAAPVYREWLRVFLSLSGANPYVPADFDRLVEHEFRGRTWDWVDPMKDVNAAVIAVQHGWKTDTQIAADYGTDFEENLAEAKRLKKDKEAAGILTNPQKVEPDKNGKGEKDGED